MDITTGMKMTLTDTVTMDNAAKTLGSGSLLVYGTPAYASPGGEDRGGSA